MFPVCRGVLRDLATPSAETGEWTRRPGTVRLRSEEASLSHPFAFLLREWRDPGGSACSRGEARCRFSWTFPNGAPPFGAFPSSAAVLRQPCFSAALLALCRLRADPVSVLFLERGSALWLGPPQSLPSRRWSQAPSVARLSSASRGCRCAGWFPFTRPQGFRPLTNPLRLPRVATRHALDAPLGFAPQRSVSAPKGSSELPPDRTRKRLFRACTGAEAPARCCGFLERRCSRGRVPAVLASQPGLRVRASLTGPPSWLALVPGGLPRWRSSAADPTGTCSRRSAGPEGLAPGATSSGLSSSQSLGDSCHAFSDPAVRARRRVRLDRLCPRDTPGSRVFCPKASGTGASVSRIVVRWLHPAWARCFHRPARRRVRPKR